MSASSRASACAPALLLCLLPAPALADHGAIIVTGHRASPTSPDAASAAIEAEHVPGGADSVAAATFADRFATSFADTLRHVPGVFAQGRYGEEVRLSIRGSGIGRNAHLRGIGLLIDGVPINLADGSGDFQEIDPSIVSHFDVRRGANALRYGGIGLGGAINAATLSARNGGEGFAARAEGGSYGAWRVHVRGGVVGDRSDMLIGMTGSGADGYREQSEQFKLRLNATLGYRLSDTAETRVTLLLNHLDQQVPGALTYRDALERPRTAPAVNRLNDYGRNIRSARLLSRTAVQLDGIGSLEFGGYFNAKSLTHPIFEVIAQQSRDGGAFARLSGAHGPVEWLAGVEAQIGTVDARRYRNVRGKKGALTAHADQRAHTLNAYGELRYSPTTALTLIAGGQAVQGRRTVDNRLAPEKSDAAGFTELSPKFGLLWQAAPTIRVFANLSRAGELPTFSELVQTGYTDFVPLDTQRSWTAEIGTRGSAGPLRWDIALYRSALRGELLAYFVDATRPAVTMNAGRTRHQGIEAALDWSLRPGVTLHAAYTLNDFRFVGDRRYGDNRLPVVPVHRLFAELHLRMGAVGLRPSLDWTPRGAWADYENSTRARGHLLVGLGGSLALSPTATLFVDARNLTDRRGTADIAAVQRATAASAIYYPLEGRSFFGGVRIGL